jgi:DNA-binding protein
VEMLDKYIEDFKEQQQKLTLQVNAINGAVQAVELIKKRLLDVVDDTTSNVSNKES